ncbi:MAG: serine hydrolase domain-containing protein [Candidatus Zixiibacteriota bacterium]
MFRMLNHLTFAILSTTCFSAGLNTVQLANPDATPANEKLSNQITALVTAYAELDMFSGVVLVAKDGIVIFEGAFGIANKDNNVPNRMNSRFNIGSIGKTFTAVAIMQLEQAGKLKFSDPLSMFFPDFPYPEKDLITIHHLLTHTSGLGDYLEHNDYRCQMSSLHKIEDALPLVYDQKPEFQSGEQFSYSNSGFLLLGAIIEKVSGKTYPEYLEEYIFKQAGMNESGIIFYDEVLTNRTIGYTKNWDGTFTANTCVVPPPCSAGGLSTTARDLLKFDQALYINTLLLEDNKARMFTPSERQPTYGCGWEIKEYLGHRFLGHSGGTDGVEAYFYRFINDGYTIITLANYDGGNGQVCSGIEAILFNQEYSIPTIADANLTLGYALQSKGKYKEAVKVLSKNSGIDPPHLMSLFFCADGRIKGNYNIEEALDG